MADQRDLSVALRDPLPFMERVHNPQDAPAPIKHESGLDMTHQMAAEEVDGRWVAFPMVQQEGDGLRDWRKEDGWYPAYQNALKNGNVLDFGEDAEKAKAFAADGYKTDEFRNYRP